jgi:hypothetical protein
VLDPHGRLVIAFHACRMGAHLPEALTFGRAVGYPAAVGSGGWGAAARLGVAPTAHADLGPGVRSAVVAAQDRLRAWPAPIRWPLLLARMLGPTRCLIECQTTSGRLTGPMSSAWRAADLSVLDVATALAVGCRRYPPSR